MSKGKRLILCCCLVLAPGIALASNPNAGICEGLQGASTPSLYGLCLAFCEAQDCVPDYNQPNPFAGCTPSSANILDLYNARKGPNDPGMPCVQPGGCPCFTVEDLEGVPTPYSSCVIDYSFGGDELTTNFISTATQNGTGAQAQVGEFTNTCAFGDGTVDPPIFIFLEVSHTAAQACRQLLVDHITANQDQCQFFCNPTTDPSCQQ